MSVEEKHKMWQVDEGRRRASRVAIDPAGNRGTETLCTYTHMVIPRLNLAVAKRKL